MGLMDMAGNVWEWMENYYDKDEDAMALRGGSFYSEAGSLLCSARGINDPGGYLFSLRGFRVLRAAPPVI